MPDNLWVNICLAYEQIVFLRIASQQIPAMVDVCVGVYGS
jgi:hypothetical protein